MKFAFSLCLAWGLSVLAPARASALLTDSQVEKIRSVVALNNKSKTMTEFAVALKNRMMPQDHADLMRIATEDFKNKPMPKIDMPSNDVLIFTEGKEVLKMRILSIDPEVYEFNGRKVDLSETTSFKDRIETIYATLPKKTSSHPLIRYFVLPEAHAFLQFILGAALAGSTVVGGTVGAVTKNDELCEKMGETLNKCYLQSEELSQWAVKKDRELAELEQGKKKKLTEDRAKKKGPLGKVKNKKKMKRQSGDDDADETTAEELDEELKAWSSIKTKKTCPQISPNDDLDKETAENLGAINNLTDRWLPKLALCGDDRLERMKKCSLVLRKKAQATCMRRAIAVDDGNPRMSNSINGADTHEKPESSGPPNLRPGNQ